MKALYVNFFILALSAEVDRGGHQEMADVKFHIDKGDLFPWLHEAMAMDLSLMDPAAETEITAALDGILQAYGGRERRKWGIEKNGLCLLISWANEILQQRFADVEI